jgi:putative aldouronate transport system substrate-binding protein
MKRRFVILLLVVALMAIAGCTSSGTNGQTVEPAATEVPEATPEQTDAADVTAGPPIAIHIYGSPETIPDTDPIIPELERRLNLDITVEKGDDASLSAIVASGSIPDVMLVSGLNYLTSFYSNGILLDLSPYMDRIPHIVEAINDIGWAKVTFEGDVYAIPGRPTGNYFGWYIRYDWLEELDTEQPTTFDALLETAVKMKDGDLDGNGKDDTYPVSGVGIADAFTGFYTAYGVTPPNTLMLVENEPVYACTSPQFKLAIEEIRRFVDAGVVDPEIVSNTWDTMREKMATGHAGIVYGGWNQFGRTTHHNILVSVDPDADWFYMRTPITTQYGEAGASKSISGSGGNGKMNCFSADLTDQPEKLEALLGMYDYITYGDGDLLMSYGIEGVHYTVENGTIVKQDAMNELYHAYALQLTGRDDLTYCLTKFVECQDAVLFCNDNVKVYWTYQGLVQQPEGMNLSDLYSYELEQLTQFIYGTRSMDEYDSFVQTLYTSYNLEAYLTSAVEQLTTMGIIK